MLIAWSPWLPVITKPLTPTLVSREYSIVKNVLFITEIHYATMSMHQSCAWSQAPAQRADAAGDAAKYLVIGTTGTSPKHLSRRVFCF
jgi:hypothetical protein